MKQVIDQDRLERLKRQVGIGSCYFLVAIQTHKLVFNHGGPQIGL